MQPVHLYLGAWVAGGLLLGASLLLDGREARPPDGEPTRASDALAEPAPGQPGAEALGPRADAASDTRPATGARLFRLCSLALIGFGLCGLTAKGLDLELWPGTLVSALGAGLLLSGLGYRLSRVAPRSPL